MVVSSVGKNVYGKKVKLELCRREIILLRNWLLDLIYRMLSWNYIYMYVYYFSIIRWNCSTSDSTYCYAFLHSVVCMSVCRLSHSCTLLKLFDGFGCHLAGTLVDLMIRCVRWGL